MSTTRRNFITRGIAVVASSSFSLPLPVRCEEKRAKLRIGLIADIHKDIMHDADQRLQAFLDASAAAQAQAVMELGDFCTPKPGNRSFADRFETFNGGKYHVIGNHDTDGGFTRDQVVAYHRMPGRYYSFDLAGIHAIVLDGNDNPPGPKHGYPSHIDNTQIEWLYDDLTKTELPVFVFSHQSLERPACIRSQEKVRAVLEQSKRSDGTRKVAACINGHWHLDHAREIHEIPYIHLNSASYYWLGSGFKRERYDAAIHKSHPYLSSTAPYKDPVFSLLEVDFAKRKFTLSAKLSEWVGPSPQELGVKPVEVDPAWIAPRCSARDGDIPG